MAILTDKTPKTNKPPKQGPIIIRLGPDKTKPPKQPKDRWLIKWGGLC